MKSVLPAESLLPEWKKEQKRIAKLSQTMLSLSKGHSWNPLRKYPRNELCFCGSGLKSKKCCLPGLPLAIKTKDAIHLRTMVNEVRRKRDELYH
jgi:hypothetical protein